MKTANNISETLRHSESGLTWEEKITNNTGTLELRKAQTFRVRATGATTVTIDGVLAATMSAGEVIIFNTGDGDPDDTKTTVSVVIGAVAAFVQVARETKRPKLTTV